MTVSNLSAEKRVVHETSRENFPRLPAETNITDSTYGPLNGNLRKA